jgi:ADP-L-glycero-D-manno-heptose 6-epimerase
MRTLVTGGAGFIGSNLATRLASEGRDVVAADTFDEGVWENLVEFIRIGGDVVTLDDGTDLQQLESLGPFDSIFHQASITGVVDAGGKADTSPAAQKQLLRTNIEGFRAVIGLARQWGSSLVWASSCSLYGRGPVPMREDATPDPLNVYAFSKLAKEQLANRYAADLAFAPVGLRYSNVYGLNERHKNALSSMIYKLAKMMRNGQQPRIFEHGQQRRDFVYIDDVINLNLAAEQATRNRQFDPSQGQVFNGGAGRSWSFNDLVQILNKVLATDLEPDYFPNPYEFTQDHTETDGTKALEALKWKPKHDLRSGVAAYEASGQLGC